MKRKAIIVLMAICALASFSFTGCDGGDSNSSKSYQYHDAAGNGYNDDDVNWNGGGKGDKSKSWDQAVGDYNRENGY